MRSPEPVSVPVRNPMEEQWPSPIARTLMTKRAEPGLGSGLIRMEHHARIAERRTLNGVLAGEGRAEEQSAGWRQLQLRIQAIGEFIGMAQERLGQAVMPAIEACMHVVVAGLDLLVREGQQAPQDRGGAGLLLVEPLVSWHEEPGDDS